MYVKPDRRASPMLKPQFKHGGFNMFKHILVPTDGSELSLKALDLACTLVGTGDTTVTALHVAPGYPAVVGDAGYMAVPVPYEVWEKSGLAQTEKIRDVVEKRAKPGDIEVVLKTFAIGFDDDRKIGKFPDDFKKVPRPEPLEP